MSRDLLERVDRRCLASYIKKVDTWIEPIHQGDIDSP